MAAPTQQALPLSSATAPAAGAQPTARKHQAAMEMDGHRIRNTDANRPFSGLQDVVERLLPFHVFAAEDASTADAEQAAEEKLQLTSGRRDAWDRQQAQAAFELSDRVEQLRSQVAAAQAHADRADAVRPEDRLAVERHLRAEAQARVDELKRQRNQQALDQANRRAVAAAAAAAAGGDVQDQPTLV